MATPCPTSSTCASSSPSWGQGSRGGSGSWTTAPILQPSHGVTPPGFLEDLSGIMLIMNNIFDFPSLHSSCCPHCLTPTCWDSLPPSKPSTPRSSKVLVLRGPNLDTQRRGVRIPAHRLKAVAHFTPYTHQGPSPRLSSRWMVDEDFSLEEQRLPFGRIRRDIALISALHGELALLRGLCPHHSGKSASCPARLLLTFWVI